MTGIHQVIASGSPGFTILQILQGQSATSGLVLCLDAGDVNSYSSGQTWTDVSGSGNHYFLGTTSGADATDPTHTGGAGNPLAYFDLGSVGSMFKATAAQTFAGGFHKNNGAFTILFIYKPKGMADDGSIDDTYFCNKGPAGSDAGLRLHAAQNNPFKFRLSHSNSTITSAASSNSTTGALALGVWNFALVSADEATTTYVTQMNGTSVTDVAGFGASTDTDASNTTPRIMAPVSDIPINTMGSQLAGVVIWNRAIGATEAGTLEAAFKSRWVDFPLYSTLVQGSLTSTITVPTGAVSCVIEAWGGGGGGGGSNNLASGGGSAGGYCKLTRAVLAGEWGTLLNFTLSAGGNGGANATRSAGGTTTSSGTLNGSAYSLTIPGGNGGIKDSNGGAASTAPTGGDTNTSSAAGGNRSGTTGGSGGTSIGPYTSTVAGALSGIVGTNTFIFGGGGSGAGDGGNTGGDGAPAWMQFTFY